MELYLSLAFFQNTLLKYESAQKKEAQGDGSIFGGIRRMPSGVHRAERSGQVRSGQVNNRVRTWRSI